MSQNLKRVRQVFVGFAMLVVSLIFGQLTNAQTKMQATFDSAMDSEAVALGHIQLDRVDINAAFSKALELGVIGPQEKSTYQSMVLEIDKRLTSMQRSGIISVNWIGRVSDFYSGGPVFWLELKPGADHDQAKAHVDQVLLLLPSFNVREVRTNGNRLVFGASKDQVDRFLAKRAKRETDPAMWQFASDSSLVFLLFGNADARRVVREIMPELKGPFSGFNRKLIADGVNWVGIRFNLEAKKQAVRVAFNAKDEQAAGEVREAIEKALPAIWNLFSGTASDQPKVQKNVKILSSAVVPIVDGRQVNLSIDSTAEDFPKVALMMNRAIGDLRAGSVTSLRKNRLRQLALGMLNFESATKAFPPQYQTVDDKPMLSWRVLILPYLDEAQLYQKFRLDEPWNSEHNLKLVNQMPVCYQDADPGSTENNFTGKTIFQVAAGKGLVFDGTQKTKFKDLIDGSSNTLLIATVAPKNAVPWTQPRDWNVDLKRPTSKLVYPGRKTVETVRCDGSTHSVPLTKSVGYWRKLLMIADGEVFRD